MHAHTHTHIHTQTHTHTHTHTHTQHARRFKIDPFWYIFRVSQVLGRSFLAYFKASNFSFEKKEMVFFLSIFVKCAAIIKHFGQGNILDVGILRSIFDANFVRTLSPCQNCDLI